MAKPKKEDLVPKRVTGKEATSKDGVEHDDVFHVERYCECGGILDAIGHAPQIASLIKNWEGRHPDGENHNGNDHKWTANRDDAVNASAKVRS